MPTWTDTNVDLPKNPKTMPQGANPIDWLEPQSDQHAWVLSQLTKRIRYSEERMSRFYDRWRINEIAMQAYVALPEFDRILKEIQESRSAPAVPVAINVPFTWATINTITTYLLHMFGGRKPIFDVSSYRGEQVKRAQNMEMLLQYNADFVKFIRALYFFLMDGETYGVGVMRTMWRIDQKKRMIQVPAPAEVQAIASSMGRGQLPTTPQQQTYISFEGNTVDNIDPFMFFPDPRVPMYEVNSKGEYVFWRAFDGRHILMREQANGRLKWVERAPTTTGTRGAAGGSSNRGMRSLGDPHPGTDRANTSIAPNYQVDQGTIEIIPSEWGLGSGTTPEKWLFTILNEGQIVQAGPLDMNHDQHPVVVVEPNSLGYAFGQLGTADMLGPMQNMMSWFMNSHIYNVRTSLNNMFVVDPTKVEMQDFQSPEPGKIIRLKNTAFGMPDPAKAVMQLPVQDITRAHLQDFNMFGKLATDLTGASDNVRGLQDSGGRKTATEVRTAADAGTSRLAAKGKLYSAMALTGLAEQQTSNYQQYLTQDFELQILGAQGQAASVRIDPDSIAGDFFFPVSDGTLPVDKVGLLDVWKEIFQAVLTDPTGELRQNFSVIELFTYLCQLGGASNIQSFKMNVAPDAAGASAIGAGNALPMQDAMAAFQQAGLGAQQ